MPGILAQHSPSAPDLVPSLAYIRLLEELETYVSPSVARQVLDDALFASGILPEEAIPFDLRAIALEELPRRLRGALRPDHVDQVLTRVDEMLMTMNSSGSGSSS